MAALKWTTEANKWQRIDLFVVKVEAIRACCKGVQHKNAMLFMQPFCVLRRNCRAIQKQTIFSNTQLKDKALIQKQSSSVSLLDLVEALYISKFQLAGDLIPKKNTRYNPLVQSCDGTYISLLYSHTFMRISSTSTTASTLVCFTALTVAIQKLYIHVHLKDYRARVYDRFGW